jgi:hypothetical protein
VGDELQPFSVAMRAYNLNWSLMMRLSREAEVSRAYPKSARPFRWTYTDPTRRIRPNKIATLANVKGSVGVTP